MAYITTTRANDILALSGDTSGWSVSTQADQSEAVQRASNRIETIPFREGSELPTRPRFTDGSDSAGNPIPATIELAVALMAAYYIRRPLVGYREPTADSDGPLRGVPEEVRDALWEYLPDAYRGDSGSDERAERALRLREKQFEADNQPRGQANAIAYDGASPSSGPSPTPSGSGVDQVARAAAADNAANIGELQVEASTLAQSIASNEGRITTLEARPAGSGGGLNQSQVDARVAAGVLDWAEAGNTDAIPAAKLTNAPGGGSTDLSSYRTSADQDVIDGRATAGILLARQEAAAADGKAVAAQEGVAEAKAAIPDLPSRPRGAGRWELVTTTNTEQWSVAGTGQTSPQTNRNTQAITALTTRATALETADTTIKAQIAALEDQGNAVIPLSPWARSGDARTVRLAIRWSVALNSGTSVIAVVGGYSTTITTSEAYTAGTWFIVPVTINSSNAGTINRETNTSNGFVVVQAAIGGDRATGYMLTQAASGGETKPPFSNHTNINVAADSNGMIDWNVDDGDRVIIALRRNGILNMRGGGVGQIAIATVQASTSDRNAKLTTGGFVAATTSSTDARGGTGAAGETITIGPRGNTICRFYSAFDDNWTWLDSFWDLRFPPS